MARVAVKGPGQYASDCGPRCGLSQERLSEEAYSLLTDLVNAGSTQNAIQTALGTVGTHIHRATIQRHMAGHVHPVDDPATTGGEDMTLEETLLAIVRAGARQINAGKVRISADTTISAINAVMKIRGGADDPLQALMESLAEEDDEDEPAASQPLVEERDGPPGYGPGEDDA